MKKHLEPEWQIELTPVHLRRGSSEPTSDSAEGDESPTEHPNRTEQDPLRLLGLVHRSLRAIETRLAAIETALAIDPDASMSPEMSIAEMATYQLKEARLRRRSSQLSTAMDTPREHPKDGQPPAQEPVAEV